MTVVQMAGYAVMIVAGVAVFAGLGLWATFSRQHHLERDWHGR